MKHNKKIAQKNLVLNFSIVVLLVIVLFFASGLTGCEKESELKFNATALTMNFIEDAPPSQLVTHEKYPVYVNVRNVGGYNIDKNNAHFYLGGIGDNLHNVETSVQNNYILEKKTAILEGGREMLTFATEAEPWRTLPAPFDITLQLDSCYNYATIVQTNICVGKGSGICSISGEKIKSGSNSAGPVQVTGLTENIIGNKLQVRFMIENKGFGHVFLPDSDCDKLQLQDITEKLKQNQVEIVIRVEEGFACRLQDENYAAIDALSGIAPVGYSVTCQKTLTDKTYKVPFEVILSYKYRETISKSIEILQA